MPNINAPRGLTPVNDASGSPYSGAVRRYYHAAADATAIFIGDLVTATGAAEFVNIGGSVQSFPVVAQGATGGIFQGVCVGIEPLDRDAAIYAPASRGVIVFVADDPDLLFLVQEVNSGTPLTASDVGLNINVVVNAGNTFTGLSGMALNNTTEATTNTLDLKIVGQYLETSNDLGANVTTGALPGRFLVKINRHRFANQVAGV